MKYICNYFFFIFILFSQMVSASPKSLTLEQLNGNWIRKKYADALTSSRSAFSESPESIKISSKSNRIEWSSYHEYSWRKILRFEFSDKEYAIIAAKNWEEDPPLSKEELRVPVTVDFDSDGKITSLRFSDNSISVFPNEKFVRLQLDLEEYANENILQGEYADENGLSYSFRAGGLAVWPTMTFPYQISLDSSEAGCDYFKTEDKTEPGGEKRFGYSWKDNLLNLYAIVYDREVPIDCEQTPFAILKLRKSTNN